MEKTPKNISKNLMSIEEKLIQCQNIIDTLPVGVVVYDASGKIHQTNKYFIQLFGYTIDDIKTVEEWFTIAYPDKNYRDEISQRWFAEIENYHVTGLFTPVEAKVKCKDGSYREIEFSFEAIDDIYLTTFVDITNRKNNERELEEAKSFNSNLLESLPGIFFMYKFEENDVKLEAWNKNHEKILGYTSEQLYRKSGLDFFRDSEKNRIKEILLKLRMEGEAIIDADIVTSTGETIPFSFNGISFQYQEADYFLGFGIDVSEKKKAEIELNNYKEHLENLVEKRTAELEEANSELKYANQLLISTNEEVQSQKDELTATLDKLKETQEQLIHAEKMASLGILTAGVSHEINNPLNFIQTSIYSLQNIINPSFLSKEEQIIYDKIIAHMKVGVERVGKIVSGLNRFGLANESKMQQYNIHKIIDNCTQLLNFEIKDKCVIEKQYFNPEFSINLNETDMHQVITNLLLNSVQSIKQNGKISISTKLIDYGKKLQLSIKDNGEGISKENLKRVYDPFFTTREPGEGTGLGLSIVYRIIKQHKGSIDIQSTEKQGTEVRIILPA